MGNNNSTDDDDHDDDNDHNGNGYENGGGRRPPKRRVTGVGNDDDYESDVVQWYTFYSEKEGREYYYNPETKVSTWIHPDVSCSENPGGREPSAPAPPSIDANENNEEGEVEMDLPLGTILHRDFIQPIQSLFSFQGGGERGRDDHHLGNDDDDDDDEKKKNETKDTVISIWKWIVLMGLAVVVLFCLLNMADTTFHPPSRELILWEPPAPPSPTSQTTTTTTTPSQQQTNDDNESNHRLQQQQGQVDERTKERIGLNAKEILQRLETSIHKTFGNETLQRIVQQRRRVTNDTNSSNPDETSSSWWWNPRRRRGLDLSTSFHQGQEILRQVAMAKKQYDSL